MRHFDPLFVSATSLILILGVIILGSVSPELVRQQLIFIFAAFVAFLITARISFKSYASLFWPLYIASLILLSLTPILGIASRGSTRWIDLGIFFIQPSELARPLIIAAFAGIVSRFPKPLSIRNMLMTTLLYLPLGALVFFQPDLGSFIVISSGILGIILAGGIKLRHVVGSLILIMILIPVMALNLHDYQKNRILSFINPYKDPLGHGYNSIQSVIATGSGGIWGRGLGQGTQSHLRFLPENHTDFIFASLAEELGLIGTLILITTYIVLYLRIFHISGKTNFTSESLACIGIFTMLSFQTLINIAMNIGIAPVTGVTLPLVSYGGSSLISTMCLLGIVQNISSSIRSSPEAITVAH